MKSCLCGGKSLRIGAFFVGLWGGIRRSRENAKYGLQSRLCDCFEVRFVRSWLQSSSAETKIFANVKILRCLTANQGKPWDAKPRF